MYRLIYNESRGNYNVGFDKQHYSTGIAQISKTVWEQYSRIPFSHAGDKKYWIENLSVGAKYLRENYERFGNWKDALSAYNMGPTALIKYKQGLRDMPAITQNYIKGFNK